MEESRLKPIQILLVDDDPDDRFLFEDALSSAGIPATLTMVEDGQKLTDYLATVELPPPPDIIFLDINMPFKNGNECLREIRSEKKYDIIPIVMFTTSEQQQDIDETFANRATMFVPKSVFFEDSKSILHDLFSLDWHEYLFNPSKDKFVLKGKKIT